VLSPLSARAQNSPLSFPAPPPAAAPPSQASSQGKDDHDRGVIRREADLVVLRATVVNQKGEFVPGLKESNFRVFENKDEQKISVFDQEDVPVSMGLVIDNSGSMRDKRSQVNAAALALVQTSNPQDEEFVVNFNDEYYLDTDHDFTNNQRELKDALDRIDARGSTALYDAVIGSLDHLKKGHKDKKVLVIVTDGDDDASRESFEYTLKAAEQSNAAIYAVGVFSEDDRRNARAMVRHSKKILTEMTEATGGMAYFPDSLSEVTPICTEIARDIRNQYTIGYHPTNDSKDGSFRTVHVDLIPPKGLGKLSVRTRTGYYADKATTAGLIDP
jgi:VWFA-related protein